MVIIAFSYKYWMLISSVHPVSTDNNVCYIVCNYIIFVEDAIDEISSIGLITVVYVVSNVLLHT